MHGLMQRIDLNTYKSAGNERRDLPKHTLYSTSANSPMADRSPSPCAMTSSATASACVIHGGAENMSGSEFAARFLCRR
jgi:hypothetical protein